MKRSFTYMSNEGKALKTPSSLSSFFDHLKRIFTLDLRALALLRIGMGVLILVDLFIRSTALEAHYSDTGLLPLDILFKHNWNRFGLSIHTISGLWQVQAVLFMLAAAFAFMLILGWKTRFATIVSWFLLLSLQNRNPMILQGGDDLFRMALFWGMFLPWGKRYSIDSMNKERLPGNNSYSGMAGVAYILQVGFVYFFSALLKDSPEWRSEGTAIYYALSLDQMVLPAGKLIYNYPELLKWLTFSVFYLELFVIFLLFVPVYTTFFRTLGVLLIISLHTGISATLFVGLFFIIGIITTFGMLPSSWMDKLDEKTARLRDWLANRINAFRNRVQQYISYSFVFRVRGLNRRRLVFAREFCIVLCLAFVVGWNLQRASVIERSTLDGVKWAGFLLRIDQNWGMFSPGVFKDDGWYILEATTKDNRKIDLNRGGAPLTYEKPDNVVALFSNDRWRKYSENYLFISNSYMRPYYADFIVRRWNEDHPDDPVIRLEVIYMKEVTAPAYRYVQPKREVLAVKEIPVEYLATEK